MRVQSLDPKPRHLFVIPVDFLPAAQEVMAALDPDEGGDETFGTIFASPSGTEPATHAIAFGVLESDVIDVLTNAPTDPDAVVSFVTNVRKRTPPPVGTVSDFAANLVMRQVTPESSVTQALAELGLLFIVPEEI